MGSVADQAVKSLIGEAGRQGNGSIADQAVADVLGSEPLDPTQPTSQKAVDVRDIIYNTVIGNGDPSIPELPAHIQGTVGPDGVLGPQMALETDPTGKINIIKRYYPGAKQGEDANGNPIVIMPDGKKYYPNRPGISWEDLDEGMSAAILAISQAMPLGRLGKIFGGPVGRIIGAGAGEGTASVTRQAMSDAAGSEQGIDLFDAGIEALFGSAGEVAFGITPELAATLARRVFRNGGYDPATRTLKPEAAAKLRNIGINVDEISPAIADRLYKLSQTDIPLGDGGAERVAAASNMPVPVELSRGNITRRAEDQILEDQAVKGALGDDAAEAARDFTQTQDQQLKENVPAIQDVISGGKRQTDTLGEGAAVAQSKLFSIAEQKKAIEDEAFKLARSTDATLPRTAAVDNVKGRLELALDEADFDVDAMPRVQSLLKFFDKKAGVNFDKDGILIDPDADVKISDLEKWRRNAVKAKGGTDEEDKAIRTLIKEYDQTMGELVSSSILQGDRETIELWNKARLESTRYREMFRNGDIVETLVTPDGKLNYSADDINRLIFGAGQLGNGKTGLANDLSKMRDILLENGGEAEWNALREDAFLKMLETQGRGNNRDQALDRIFSGDKFATALDNALQKNKEAMEVLFDADEMNLLKQFRDVALSVTNTVKGGQNYSNSASAAANVVRQMARSFGFIGRSGEVVLDGFIRRFEAASGADAARKAFSPTGRPISTPPGLGAGAAAPAGQEANEQRNKPR